MFIVTELTEDFEAIVTNNTIRKKKLGETRDGIKLAVTDQKLEGRQHDVLESAEQ